MGKLTASPIVHVERRFSVAICRRSQKGKGSPSGAALLDVTWVPELLQEAAVLEGFLHRGTDLGGRVGDDRAGGAKSGLLVLGFAVLAGDDRAGVAHAAPGRRGGAGDERDDRLLHVFLDVGGCFLFGRATDFADHHDRVGVGVFVEHADGFDLAGADDRVAADADAGALADAFGGELGDDFVDQRAGAADHADAAREEDIAGHDADAGLRRGGDDAGAVGPDEDALRTLERSLDLDHVEDGDAFGDADDQREAGGGSFEDGVGGERRGHEDNSDVGAGLADGLIDRGEDGHAVLLFAAAPGVDGGDDVCPVGDGTAHVVRALGPDALDHQAGVCIDEHGHEAISDSAISGFRPASGRMGGFGCPDRDDTGRGG